MRLPAAAALLALAARGVSADDRLLPHADDERAWVGGQLNVIAQAHPAFHAAYSGPNSLSPEAEAAVSFVGTFGAALRLARFTEASVAVEMAAGSGLSKALGVAGFPDADAVRNPSLSSEPYLARAVLRQVVPLSDALERAEPGMTSAARTLPRERLELRAGRMSTVEIFDVNAVGSDSHLQFMNWALVNDASYDYAADTRGYTWGLAALWERPELSVRAAVFLMPKVANGPELDWDVLSARAENLEVDVRWGLGGRRGVVRVRGFANHARMGSYPAALDAWRAGAVPAPDVTSTREKGRVKLGAGASLEQELGVVRVFARAGVSDGAVESFAYTEVDDHLSGGLDLAGETWGRTGDRAGLALASNGLAAPHRDYLAAGGLGFILGDGALTYGRETIAELYYTARLAPGVYVAADVQGIGRPGYNRDRGPVLVVGLRLHADL